jgi:hypothetical protein
MSETRTLHEMFDTLGNKNSEFVQMYSGTLNKKWYKVVKYDVHNARVGAALKYGKAKEELEVGMVVATFVDADREDFEEKHYKAYGRYFWLGRVTYVNDYANPVPGQPGYKVRAMSCSC